MEMQLELPDKLTLGQLRQVARTLGRELRITFAQEGPPPATSSARALTTPPPTPPPTPATATAGDRDGLVALLEANQWNILRVSKMVGVARRTLYLRMKRWGIHRQKPKKSLKPATR